MGGDRFGKKPPAPFQKLDIGSEKDIAPFVLDDDSEEVMSQRSKNNPFEPVHPA